MRSMKIKQFTTGNLDGERRGLVLATSKKAAIEAIGRISLRDFNNSWVERQDEEKESGDFDVGVLYTKPISYGPSQFKWVKGRCPIPPRQGPSSSHGGLKAKQENTSFPNGVSSTPQPAALTHGFAVCRHRFIDPPNKHFTVMFTQVIQTDEGKGPTLVEFDISGGKRDRTVRLTLQETKHLQYHLQMALNKIEEMNGP